MPPELLAALTGLVGVTVGTIVAFIVEQMPRGLPILANPMQCPACGKPLAMTALLPFAGFLDRGGACSACGAFSLRRKAIIEVATALSFALIGWRFGPTLKMTVYLWYAALFVAVFAIDLEHRLILNRMIYPAIAIAPFTAVLSGVSLLSSLLGGATGFGLMFGLYLLGELIFGPDRGALGLGDVKLGLFIGLVTGVQRVLPAMFAFSLLAGLVSLILLLTRRKGLQNHIPYGPFMVIGAAWALWMG